MAQSVITNPDGSHIELISREGVRSVIKAEQNCQLLGEDVVSITAESAHPITFKIGGRIDVYGKTYTLNQAPEPNKSAGRYVYDLRFEGVQYELLDATFLLPAGTIGDSLTGDIENFVALIISNANRVFPGKWSLGDFPAGSEYKTLTFSDENCLAVLQRLCEEYEQEFEITQSAGNRVIHIRKPGAHFPFTFKYGRAGGLYELTRKNVDSKNLVTRLYVYGGSQNLPEQYLIDKGVAKLCLAAKVKGTSYLEDAGAITAYGLKENTKTFADIYPNRIGVVSGLGADEKTFVDSSMSFDLNEKEFDGVTTKWIIAGTKPKIAFRTGKLAGYDFEASYDHASKTFVLIPFSDEFKMTFPSPNSAAFRVSVGDEYIIADIRLPQAYIDEAETKLQTVAEEYYTQNSQPRVQYDLQIDRNFLKQYAGSGSVPNVFAPGDYIPVQDEDLELDREIRIVGFTRNLLTDYEYKLSLGDAVSRSIITRIIADQVEVDRIISMNNLNDPSRARANWRSSREFLSMVFDPEGDYYSEKIKPLSIDTNALSVGAKSMQFGLTNTVIEANYLSNPNLVRVTGGTLTHYTIDHGTTRSWYLSSGEVTLTGGNSQAYYIYVKCNRSGTGGSIIFSTEQIPVEQDASWYHFWVGVLNSVDPELGIRMVSLSYGSTFINGREVKTGRISSSGGSGSYFDLDENKFRIGTPSKGISWNEAGDGSLILKGTLVQSGSGATFPIGIFRGAYGAGVTYYKGDEVTFGGSTYRYINDAPTTGTPTSNTSYWTVVANKGADGSGDYFEYRYAKNGSSSAPPELIITDAVPDGWVTVTLPISGTEYLWMSMAKKTSTGVLLSYWGPPVRVNTLAEQGEAGSSPVLVYCGEYSAGKTYYGNSNRLDAVEYSGLYYLARIDAGAFSGVLPTNTSKWNSFGANFESVATNLLLAEGANIGDWFMSGGKIVSTLGTANGTKKIFLDAVNNKIEMTEVGSTKKILIDANNSKIEVVALDYGISGSTDGNESSTVKIDAQTGVVEARNANGVSYISASGVFSNRPKTRTASPASGINQLGSIVGLGVANDSTSDLVAGVIGVAQNSGSAPAYGGWFKDLFANGLFAATRRIDASTGITIQDTMIVLYGGSSYSVTLPVVAQEGNVKFIKNIGTGTKTLYPGSGQDLYDDNSVNSSYPIENGRLIILHSVYVSGVMSWVITKMG